MPIACLIARWLDKRINNFPRQRDTTEIRLPISHRSKSLPVTYVNRQLQPNCSHHVSPLPHSEHLSRNKRDKNPNLPLPRRRGPPTLRTIKSLPRANRPPRSRSRHKRYPPKQGRQTCHPIHPNPANHHQHRHRLPRPHAARTSQARRHESGSPRQG